MIDVNQMRRSWYFDYLEQMYPDLIEANREKVMAFLDDLHRWELDPGLYAADPKLSGRIEAGFTNLLLSFVQYQTAHNKVYVTQEIGEIYAASAANLSRNPAFNPSATLGPDGNWVTTVSRETWAGKPSERFISPFLCCYADLAYDEKAITGKPEREVSWRFG